jgi:hypothetical protein
MNIPEELRPEDSSLRCVGLQVSSNDIGGCLQVCTMKEGRGLVASYKPGVNRTCRPAPRRELRDIPFH